MISNLSYVYTLIHGNIPSIIRPILDHNIRLCNSQGIHFKVLSFDVDPGECAAGKSDWLRIEKASKEPNIMYVDWDCQIEKFYEFDPNVPLVSKWEEAGRNVDLWAFYNGNRTDLFDVLYKSLKGKMGGLESYYAIINSVAFRKNIKEFPLIYFKHLATGTGRVFKPVMVEVE